MFRLKFSLFFSFHQIIIRGFQVLSRLQIESLHGEDGWIAVDTLLLSSISALLGILCLACFLIDTKSTHEWTIYNVRDIIAGQRLVRDIASCSMAMAHFTAIEFFGWHPGILLWHFSAIVTILYTSFVACMIGKLSGSANLVKTARAWPVVGFGLRYGLLTSCCGLGPSVGSVIALRLLKEMAKLPDYATSEDSECFISNFNVSHLAFGAIAGLAYYFSVAIKEFSLAPLMQLLVASIVLVYLNALVFILHKIGHKLGEENVVNGSRSFNLSSLDADAFLRALHPTPLGTSVFGICSFLLLCITIA